MPGFWCCCKQGLPPGVQVLTQGALLRWDHDIFGSPTLRRIDGDNPSQFTGNNHGTSREYDWIYFIADAFGDDFNYGMLLLLTNLNNGQLLSSYTVQFHTWTGPIDIAQDYEFKCISSSNYKNTLPLRYSDFGAGTVTWSPGIFPDNGTLTTPNLAGLANELIGAAHYPTNGTGPWGGKRVPIMMYPVAPKTTNSLRRNEFGLPLAASFSAVLA